MTDGDHSADGTDPMASVDHTHPETGESFGEAFRRGPAVAADGGERGVDGGKSGADGSSREPGDGASGPEPGADGEASSDGTDETMADVDHEPPTDGVDRAFERGTEGRTDTV